MPRVLIVEDDPALLRGVSDNFAARGFGVETAADGETGLEKARRVLDQEERLRLYSQADKILIEEAAVIPLTYSWSHTLVKPWVRQFPALALNQWRWKNIIIEAH